jgi:hypothetical protein
VPNVPLAQKLFLTHPMVLLGDKARVEACLCPFGDYSNLKAQVEACLGLFGDSAKLNPR